MTLADELHRAAGILDTLEDDTLDALDEKQLGELSEICRRAAGAISAAVDKKAPMHEKHEDIYQAMNILDGAIGARSTDDLVGAIEAWLNEPDQDCPSYRDILAETVQDAVKHAGTINEGKHTITIVAPNDGELLRFEWFIEDEHSLVFERTVVQAVKNALRGRH